MCVRAVLICVQTGTMGKACTVYKDIGKLANDLLTKDFKQVGKTTVEIESKTASGVVSAVVLPRRRSSSHPRAGGLGLTRVPRPRTPRAQTFTPKADKEDKKGKTVVSGELKAAYMILPWLEGIGTFTTAGGMSSEFKATDLLVKGLLITAECEKAMADGDKPAKGFFAKANMILEYKTDLMTCKTSFDYIKKDLLASCSTVYGAFTCGADCSLSPAGKLKKGAIAFQCVLPEYTVSGKYEMDPAKSDAVSCSLYHKVSPLMQVGVAVKKPLSAAAFGVDFGCQYKLDKDTTVKSKVDADGKLSLAYKQKISSLTTMTLAAEINAVNLQASDHKFGLALNITP